MARARTVGFRNTLIIMISNLGSEYLVNQPEGEHMSAVPQSPLRLRGEGFRSCQAGRVSAYCCVVEKPHAVRLAALGVNSC
jgi:hypothetical protein